MRVMVGGRRPTEEVREVDMSYAEMLELVLSVARVQARKGPGWSQQQTVLSEVARQVRGDARDPQVQQLILTCWHDLFRLGKLSWGYDLDNPDAPFFHVPEPEPRRDRLVAV
jgi:hypothetical protein